MKTEPTGVYLNLPRCNICHTPNRLWAVRFSLPDKDMLICFDCMKLAMARLPSALEEAGSNFGYAVVLETHELSEEATTLSNLDKTLN